MALRKRPPILTDDEIINIILKYIDENIYNYAVMIDGEWGCGKTYFVRETLIPAIAENEEDETRRWKAARSIYVAIWSQFCRRDFKANNSKRIFRKGRKSKGANSDKFQNFWSGIICSTCLWHRYRC